MTVSQGILPVDKCRSSMITGSSFGLRGKIPRSAQGRVKLDPLRRRENSFPRLLQSYVSERWIALCLSRLYAKTFAASCGVVPPNGCLDSTLRPLDLQHLSSLFATSDPALQPTRIYLPQIQSFRVFNSTSANDSAIRRGSFLILFNMNFS